MSVVTNNNFAHLGFGASFYIVLTMKTSSMSLYAVEFENFSFPFVKLLAEWREKHGIIIFHSSKLTVRHAYPQALLNLRHKEAAFHAFLETWKKYIPAFSRRPSYEDECHLKFSL